MGAEINNGAIAILLARTSKIITRLELRLYEMSDFLSRMASADQRMREYMTIDQDLEQSTLESFASWCVSHEAGAASNLLERLHSLVVSSLKHILGSSTTCTAQWRWHPTPRWPRVRRFIAPQAITSNYEQYITLDPPPDVMSVIT